jgi:hypothetical protein
VVTLPVGQQIDTKLGIIGKAAIFPGLFGWRILKNVGRLAIKGISEKNHANREHT